MLVLNTKTMSGVHVETRSGQAVGKVTTFDLDAATGRLVQMHVKIPGGVPMLLTEDLMVPWDAIIEMTEEKVVISDALVPFASEAVAGNPPIVSPSA